MFVVFLLVTVTVPSCVVIWSVAGLSVWQGVLLMVLSVTVVPIIGLAATLGIQHLVGRREPKAVTANRTG